MHSTIGASGVRLLVFVLQPTLMLVVVLVLYKYKMGQGNKSVREVLLSNNVHSVLQNVFDSVEFKKVGKHRKKKLLTRFPSFFLVSAVVTEMVKLRLFLARAHHRKKYFIDGYFAGLCKVFACL